MLLNITTVFIPTCAFDPISDTPSALPFPLREFLVSPQCTAETRLSFLSFLLCPRRIVLVIGTLTNLYNISEFLIVSSMTNRRSLFYVKKIRKDKEKR